MDTQQQQQQQQYHYQYQQPQNDSTCVSASQSYDPSQVQAYDQSTQAYYAYHGHYNHPQQQQQQPQQDYSSYYYPDYSNSYQTHLQTDPNSIHPPGVPIQVDAHQTHVQDPQNLYYQHGVIASQPPAPQGFVPPSHSAAPRGGRSVRGGRRGAFGRHGRGRGGARGKHIASQGRTSSAPAAAGGAQSSSVEVHGAANKQPPRMAWCEVCRVDCNTHEILEQHKNGKRHKRNLKVYEELQTLSRQVSTQNQQMSLSCPKIPEGSEGNHPPTEGVSSEPAPNENKAEAGAVAVPSEQSVRKDQFGVRGGFKRKMRGARGGKWMRAPDGSRRPVEPPKPKQMVPLICDLCNVKCESQVVFESHLAGKKHLSNVKRFQGHKEAFGERIQALYPTIPNLPSTSIISQGNQQGPQDAQALASMMLSQQNLQDPQAAQAALAQLLNQHGIHDAQTLIAQLIPYLLTQFQVPGSVPVPPPVAEFGVDTQIPQSHGAHISIGAETQNLATENKTEQQNVTGNAESQPDEVTDDKPDDELPGNENVPTKEEIAGSKMQNPRKTEDS